MALSGKGMMIWKIPDCEGGSPTKIGRVAKKAGFSHVLIKIANDTRPYNVDVSGNDLVGPVVDELKSQGIQAWGWHYVYGYDPLGEAKIAISQVKKFALDGYVIDAEIEYKAVGRDAVARTFMTALRKGLPSTPVALSTFRWPSYHPTFPYTAFLEKCDLNMPQVYWMQAHNPDYDLTRSVTEFKAIKPYRPVFPTGPSCREYGWEPTPADVVLFMDTAKKLGLAGVNYFSWDDARKNVPAVWDAIANYNWPPTVETPVVKDLADKIIKALNVCNYDRFLKLYADDAVLVTPQKTIQGNVEIRKFWGRLLTNKLNDGVFTITSKEIGENTIHYTWKCKSPRGSVKDGSDTIGFMDGKVTYHYSNFTIIPV